MFVRGSLQYEWLPTRKEISASTHKGNLLFAGAKFQEYDFYGTEYLLGKAEIVTTFYVLSEHDI